MKLHPKDVWFYLLTHLDAGIIIGGAIAGSALLITAGGIERSRMRSYYFAGAAVVAVSGKRGRAIFSRTQPMMTLATEESLSAQKTWLQQALNPAAETIDATILGAQNIQPANLDALGQKNTLIVGASGTGKSTIAKALAKRLGGRVTVLDPHNKKRDWGDLPVIGGGRNFAAINEYLKAQIEEMDNRYKLRNLGIEDFLMAITIIDESPAIAANCDAWGDYIRAMAREARKVLLPVVVLAQDDNAKTLDIEGEAALREGFDRLYLGTLALKKARSLKDAAVVEWLRQCKRPGLFNESPLEVPDLTGLSLTPFGQLPPTEEDKQLPPAQVDAESDREPAPKEDLPATDTKPTTTDDDAEYTLFLAIQGNLQAGKSKTWIVENVLKCRSRKFKAGMERLNAMIERFGGVEG